MLQCCNIAIVLESYTCTRVRPYCNTRSFSKPAKAAATRNGAEARKDDGEARQILPSDKIQRIYRYHICIIPPASTTMKMSVLLWYFIQCQSGSVVAVITQQHQRGGPSSTLHCCGLFLGQSHAKRASTTERVVGTAHTASSSSCRALAVAVAVAAEAAAATCSICGTMWATRASSGTSSWSSSSGLMVRAHACF